MKRMVALLMLAGCATGPAAGGPAPDFALKDSDGHAVRGSSLWAAEPVTLVFMSSWCGSCRAEVPQVNSLSKRTQVVAVCTGDTPEKVLRFQAETGAMYRILLDSGDVAAAFGILRTPTFVKVDRGGMIVYRGGEIPR